MIFLVAINKEEKDMIKRVYPSTHVVRTMKQDSRRHHYYMEESNGAMRLLRSIRSNEYQKKEHYCRCCEKPESTNVV